MELTDRLTQYGNVREGGFRRRPRRDIEAAISVIQGNLSVEEATRLVRGRRPRHGDAVRYSTVGVLIASGFTVQADPVPLNPEHCLVEYPGEWTEEVAMALDRCFEEPVVEGPP